MDAYQYEGGGDDVLVEELDSSSNMHRTDSRKLSSALFIRRP